jgi:hypothetical protein
VLLEYVVKYVVQIWASGTSLRRTRTSRSTSEDRGEADIEGQEVTVERIVVGTIVGFRTVVVNTRKTGWVTVRVVIASAAMERKLVLILILILVIVRVAMELLHEVPGETCASKLSVS